MENTNNIEYLDKPSENNLVAFLVEKIERKWYNCVGVGWEIQRRCQDLYV